MKNLFKFKKLSWKLAVIVGVTIFTAAGSVAAFMQYRLITEMNKQLDLYVDNQLKEVKEECNLNLSEVTAKTTVIKSLAESLMDVDKYKADASGYFENTLKQDMSNFISSLVKSNDFIESAYFAIDPDLSGEPYVCELYYLKTEDGVELGELQTYEEYMDLDSPDMEWFYGAFLSEAPYWTDIYGWMDGSTVISYVEPVIVDSKVIGVAGVDINIENLKSIVEKVKAYDTGFIVFSDNSNNFIESNEKIKTITEGEKKAISENVLENKVSDVKLGGVNYKASKQRINSQYSLYILAPEKEVMSEISTSITKFILLFVFAVVLIVFISFLIGKSISKPLIVLARFMKKAGETGDVTLKQEEIALVNVMANKRDEVAQCIGASADFLKYIEGVSEKLKNIANGDLTDEIELLSENDSLGKSLKYMSSNLNHMFGEINMSAEQVSQSANEVATTATTIANSSVNMAAFSQSLAEDATKQAASMDELSGLVEGIDEKTKDNAEIAGQAAKLANAMIQKAEKSRSQMNEAIKAVNDITKSSKEVETIMGTINNIAAQTNLLSLNAAIEAARVGEQGKGFAVVANEIRNLAMRSGDSVGESNAIIQTSIENAEMGARIVSEMAESIAAIINDINESDQLILEIADATMEQSDAISQINGNMKEVSNIIQKNSVTSQEGASSTDKTAAAAEQSAAVSEEMSAQALMLGDLISQFKLK